MTTAGLTSDVTLTMALPPILLLQPMLLVADMV
jgi:hypothetical protein